MYAQLSDAAARADVAARGWNALRGRRRRPHARAGPRRRRCATRESSRSRSRPASSAPCAASSSSPIGRGRGRQGGVDWRAELVYPGLRRGERLRRETSLPPRADDPGPRRHRARRGRRPGVRPRPSGRRRSPAASARPAGARGRARSRGVPAGAAVGLTGLERQFDAAPRGHPRRTLLRRASRVLADARAERRPRRADDDRPEGPARGGGGAGRPLRRDRRAAPARRRGPRARRDRPVGAPAARLGVQDHHARRRAGGQVVKRTRAFPIQTSATLEGVELENANGESCGGSLRTSFAHSCNSVFAPLGAEARRGAAGRRRRALRLQRGPAAEGRRPLDDPAADEIGDDLAVGSTRHRPGQGAGDAAADGARRGHDRRRRHAPAPDPAHGRRDRAACAPRRRGRPHDRELHALRRDRRHRRRGRRAGRQGRGQDRHRGAAHDGQGGAGPEVTDPTQPPPEDDTTRHRRLVHRVRAAGKPSVAVAVLLVGQGTGGDTAAPAAGLVLKAALG